MNYLNRTVSNGLSTAELSKPITLILSFLILFFSSSVFSQQKKQDLVKSTFVSKPADPYSFIKKQLIYEGFRMAISDELKTMNLDEKTFWQKYDEKFIETFSSKEESIKKKYGIDDPEKKVSSVTRHRYEEQLRMARLASLSRFGNVSKVVSRFSVKKISRSTRNPNRRYMRMNVKINRRSLQKLYVQFVSDSHEMHYDRLIIFSNISLENGVWTDLGVSNKAVMSAALNESWQKWFSNNYSNLSNLIEFENTKLLVETNEEENSGQSVSESEAQIDQQLISDAEKMTEEDNSSKTIKELKIGIEVKIKKTFEDDLENKIGFGIKIFVNVFDPETNKLIASSDITQEPQNFNTRDVKELSSNIASAIYNLPLKKLERIKADIIKNKNQFHIVNIEFKHYPADLIFLRSKIEELGLGAGIEAQVLKYRPELSQIKVNHSTDKNKLTDILVRINEEELLKSNNVIVKYNDLTNDYTIAANSESGEVIKKEKASNEKTTEVNQ